MLDRVIDFFASELNAYFQARTGVLGTTVVASAVVDDAGKYIIPANNIALTIINIEEDSILKEQLPTQRFQQGQQVSFEPKLKLKLSILFSAHYTLYDQALKHLSLVLTYFQHRSVFTQESHPQLVQYDLERITTELQTLNYDQLNQVWAYIGAKHLPSIAYKINLVSIQEQTSTGVTPPISTITTEIAEP